MSEPIEKATQESIEGNVAVPEEENEKERRDVLELSKDGKPTKGEKLFLEYIDHRKEEPPSADDFDFESPVKKARVSLGEQLWHVHLCRSRGLEPDLDVETNEANVTSSNKKLSKKRAIAKPKKPARCSERLASTLHLRSRDIHKRLIS